LSGWGRGRRGRPGRWLPPTHEAHLPLLDSEALKRIARFWCGGDAARWRKEECVAQVLRSLGDPAKVRRLLDSGPYARKALGILRALGGEAEARECAIEIAALGLEPPPGRFESHWRHGQTLATRLLNPLIAYGLLLPRWREGRSSSFGMDPLLGDFHEHGRYFSDERILREVEPVAPSPLPLAPVEGSPAGKWRRPAEVLLPLATLARALSRGGEMHARATGAPTPSAWRRLSKEVEVPEEEASLARMFALALATGLAEFHEYERTIRLARNVEDLLRRPIPEQARGWFEALRAHPSFASRVPWETPAGIDEDPDARFPLDGEDSWESLPHAIALRALGTVPAIREGWYDAEAFSEALFERAGMLAEWGLYDSGEASAAGRDPAREAWRREQTERVRKRWREERAPRIAGLIRGALFETGLMEVCVVPGSKGTERTLFRPTPLGALAMGWAPPARATEAPPATPPAPCAVVQPNLEVVVDLGGASPDFLLWCERSARRVSIGPAAVYRLEREALCAALASGETLDSFLGTLRRHSAREVPANVEATLRDWARRRERLVVRQSVRLLEYGGRADRDTALAAGVGGAACGERFLLLDPAVGRKTARSLARRTLDHEPPPERSLEAEEDGSLTLDPMHADFLAEAEVGAFSDPHPDGRPGRRLVTRGTLARAVASGLRAGEILRRLESRSSRPLLPLLVATIRAAERATPFQVGEVEVLRLEDPEALRAIATSPRLRKHFAGLLGPDTLLLHPGHREEVEEILLGLGFRKGSVPLPPMPAAETPPPIGGDEEAEPVVYTPPQSVPRRLRRLAQLEREEVEGEAGER
jgi:XPB/Ssl2-like helicase family protein